MILRKLLSAVGIVVALVSVLSAAVHHHPLPLSVLPLSDPLNTRGWKPYEPLTDEFEGEKLNATKWTTNTGWAGRKPGLFDPGNIVVKDGQLQLWARAARRNASWPVGYDNFTTSALHSVDRTAHGYFEVRSQSGSSLISSSWWFHQNDGKSWTEIDVFESTGSRSPIVPGMNSTSFCSHTHIFS